MRTCQPPIIVFVFFCRNKFLVQYCYERKVGNHEKNAKSRNHVFSALKFWITKCCQNVTFFQFACNIALKEIIKFITFGIIAVGFQNFRKLYLQHTSGKMFIQQWIFNYNGSIVSTIFRCLPSVSCIDSDSNVRESSGHVTIVCLTILAFLLITSTVFPLASERGVSQGEGSPNSNSGGSPPAGRGRQRKHCSSRIYRRRTCNSIEGSLVLSVQGPGGLHQRCYGPE